MHVFSRFGTPCQLLSDRGPEFESALFGQLMRWLDIDKLRITPYKPSTNGAVERFNRTLNSMLGKIVNDSQQDCDERLPLVMAAYRASCHGSTGYTPNRLFLGRETCMPLDLVMGVIDSDARTEKSVDEFIQQIKDFITFISTMNVMKSRVSTLKRWRKGGRKHTIFVLRKLRFG
jgi:hypothetical protein